MSEPLLKSLEVNNFRSIRGLVHAPLDARVILVHGENGAGKTSLLSAIELALTGRVQALERADPAYMKQLLHRSAIAGSVAVQTLLDESVHSYKSLLTPGGVHSTATLDLAKANFFRERAFLPQALLGQLLQIYQEAGSDAGSPLAQFVGNLLGLDRLDALEAGLKPLADVRNVRKNVDGWSEAENEKSRLDRLIADHGRARQGIQTQIDTALSEFRQIVADLGLELLVGEANLDAAGAAMQDEGESGAFADLSDQRRRLGALRREIEAAQRSRGTLPPTAPMDANDASEKFRNWQYDHGDRINAFRNRVQGLFSDLTLESDPEVAAQTSLTRLGTEQKQLSQRVSQERADLSRLATAQDERDVAAGQRDTIDEEVGRLSSSAGSLGSALAELTAFITDETCPVCDRDFGQVSAIPLSEHVHAKVRTLSASAERLLTLGRTRGEVQVTIERLDREIEMIGARQLGEEALADMDRRLAAVEALTAELTSLSEILAEGSQLRSLDVAARRTVSETRSRDVALESARQTLSDFALSIGTDPVTDGETFEAGFARLDVMLSDKASGLETRLAKRRRGGDLIATLRSLLLRRQEEDARSKVDFAAWQLLEKQLEAAQVLRDQGNGIRNAVDTVRSAIIRREFNDRLNKVWRDLFVRLAPGEPFVPAFSIPADSTQKLQPKLITQHRDGGDAGGTPGAMLSAGNLNTAALTLFIALHLSVPIELPWLILDDPVQSMDDVHIAHFAALLRTLSKEHGRQVMIAVHDRQLFEYLKLELSPAFVGDSLLTLELSRGPRRDTVCISQRHSFKEEAALLAAA
jgi:exonuclease SbcC